MPGPFDYSLGNMPDPSQAFAGGLQQGVGIQALLAQQQQQQLAQQQQAQQAQVLSGLIAKQNPTADDYARATLAVPGMREHFKQSWDMHNADQQQASLAEIGQVHAALTAGQPQFAVDILRNRAAALKNSGGDPQHIRAAEDMAATIEANPAFARSLTGMKLASIPGGDKVLGNLGALGQEDRAAAKAPADLRTANADAAIKEADAVIKAVQAGNAPTATVLGNAKTSQEIKASQLAGEVATLNAQIAAANSETERGRLTLERDKLIAEQAKLGQAQGQAAQDSQNLASSALSTLSQIKDHPAFKSQEYGGVWSKIKGFIPGTDRQAMEGWVDSLKSQLGYQNLMAAKAASPTGASGFGALSEGELKLLTNIAGNLDLNSADFPKQLDMVQKYLQKAQSTAVSRPQLPNKGEAFVMQVPGIGAVNEGHINMLMREHPGQTREQAIAYLRSIGGK